jgi:hypothetical protein
VLTPTSVLYPKGSRPPESSETTAGLGVGYNVQLPGAYTARFDGSVDYISKLLTAASTTAAAQAGDDLLIARTSVTFSAPTGWSAMLFVDNLNDEDGRIPGTKTSRASRGAMSVEITCLTCQVAFNPPSFHIF